jgi:hypothetical protein
VHDFEQITDDGLISYIAVEKSRAFNTLVEEVIVSEPRKGKKTTSWLRPVGL